MADEEGMEHRRSRELYSCPAIVDLSTKMHALEVKGLGTHPVLQRVNCKRSQLICCYIIE